MSDIIFKEEQIKSPIDNSDKCYRIFTEPKTDDHYLCMTTGFMSNTAYSVGSDKLNQELERSPELVKALQHFDEERELVWLPTILNIPGKGMIYPDGTLEKWEWCHASVIEIPEDERKNYPIPDKDGEFFDSKLDVDNSQRFDKFYEACISMGLLTKDFKGSLINADKV